MEKKRGGISLAFIAIIFIGWIIYSQRSVNELLENHQIIPNGRIDNFHIGGNGHAGELIVEYDFYLNGKTLESSSIYTTKELNPGDFRQYFVGRYFPVAYQTNDPSNSIILITPRSFEHYKCTFPDSLKWVLTYLNRYP